MSIDSLLKEAEQPAPPLSGLDALLAEEREYESLAVDISVGDAVGHLVITELSGMTWATDVTARAGLPRWGNSVDAKIGCNAEDLIRGYPITHLTIDGENPTAEQWSQLCDLLGAPACDDITAALWWIHIGAPQEHIRTLTRPVPHVRSAAPEAAAGEPDRGENYGI